ncbi:MAG: hypothetical protein RLZZ344_1444 [Pseudomonadota bacterium]
MRMRGLAAYLATGLAGGLGGMLFAALGLPLPWLLGSLCAVSLLSLTAGAAPLPRSGVRAGQMTIGLALGLYFTAPVIVALARDGHWIVLSALLTCGLSLFGAMVFQRLTGSDATTSLYAGAIGAASDMAQQAAASGARADVVALVHSIRVFIVVGSVPFLASAWISLAGHPGASQNASGLTDSFVPSVLGLSQTALLASLAVVAASGLGRLRLPNPWVLGPLAVALAVAVWWLPDARLAPWLVGIGQVLLGWNLGQRFDRTQLQAFAPAARAAVVMTLFYGLAGLGLARLVSWGAGLSGVVAFMATAPGGIAEMAIVAKILGLDPPTVTVFHAVRMVMMVVLAQTLLALGLRLGLLRVGRLPAG